MSTVFLNNNADMINAAKHCIDQRQHLPALVLIYSHIDTLAWAGSAKQKQSVRRNFEEWVSKWLLPELSVKAPTVTATDLFAARCGILHSHTSKSDLSASGAAREIAYAWGVAESSALDRAIAQALLKGKLVTLHYDALLTALEEAIHKFLASAASDSALMAQLEEAASKHFVNIPAQI